MRLKVKVGKDRQGPFEDLMLLSDMVIFVF
jgi:hypothetical protein